MASEPGRSPKRTRPRADSFTRATPSLYEPSPADEPDGSVADLEGVGIVGPWPGSRLTPPQPAGQRAGETAAPDPGVEGRSVGRTGTAESVSAARARLREWIRRQAEGRPDEAAGPPDTGLEAEAPQA
jgi:hypothetical protein